MRRTVFNMREIDIYESRIPLRSNILGCPVDHVNSASLQKTIIEKAKQREGLMVTYSTAWTIVMAQRDAKIKKQLSSFHFCYPDGTGVLIAAWIILRERIYKVTANSFYSSFFSSIHENGLSIALIGSTQNTIETAAEKIRMCVPGIKISICSAGFFNEFRENLISSQINLAKPNIVFLGLGQPLQEHYAQKWHVMFPDIVFFCVGGLFDVIAGNAPTPPSWIRNNGFEWLWRLCHSPRKLWRRYLLGLPVFAYYISRELIVTKSHHKS